MTAPFAPAFLGPALEVGVRSGEFVLPADAEILFRFEAPARRVYVATTASEADLVLDLLDGGERPLHSDDGSGLDGNPLLAAPLEPGAYYLRVRGARPEVSGPFRVRVAIV